MNDFIFLTMKRDIVIGVEGYERRHQEVPLFYSFTLYLHVLCYKLFYRITKYILPSYLPFKFFSYKISYFPHVKINDG